MKMNKPLLIIIFAIFIVACDANDNEKVNQNNNSEENSNLEEITFVGESDNWKVDLQFVHKDKQEEREFKLTYKGEDVDSVEEINYEVQGSGRFDHNGAQLNDEGYVTDSGFRSEERRVGKECRLCWWRWRELERR